MTNDTNEPTVPTIDFIDRKQLSEASVSNSSALLWPIRVPLSGLPQHLLRTIQRFQQAQMGIR
jgi:hypothetical protein